MLGYMFWIWFLHGFGNPAGFGEGRFQNLAGETLKEGGSLSVIIILSIL